MYASFTRPSSICTTTAIARCGGLETGFSSTTLTSNGVCNVTFSSPCGALAGRDFESLFFEGASRFKCTVEGWGFARMALTLAVTWLLLLSCEFAGEAIEGAGAVVARGSETFGGTFPVLKDEATLLLALIKPSASPAVVPITAVAITIKRSEAAATFWRAPISDGVSRPWRDLEKEVTIL